MGGFSFSFRLPVWDVLPLPQEGYGSLEDTESLAVWEFDWIPEAGK